MRLRPYTLSILHRDGTRATRLEVRVAGLNRARVGMDQQKPDELLVRVSEYLSVLNSHDGASALTRRSIVEILANDLEKDCLEIPGLLVLCARAMAHFQLKKAKNALFA
ncbi:hypothetical protein D3C72_1581580 [compost metagenome]